MNGNGRAWYQFFAKLTDIRLTYGQLKADEEAKRTSTNLGGKAIVYNITFVIFIALGVAGLIFGASIMDGTSFIAGLVVLICGIAFAIGSIFQFILALVSAIYQIRLNKKAIGWVSLSISFLIIIAAVVAVIIGINSL